MRTSASCSACGKSIKAQMLGRGMVWPGRIRCPHCLTAIPAQGMGWLWIALLLLIAAPFAAAVCRLISQPVMGAIVGVLYLVVHRPMASAVIGWAHFPPYRPGPLPAPPLLQAGDDGVPSSYEGRHRGIMLRYRLSGDRLEGTFPDGIRTWPLVRMNPEPIVHREWTRLFVVGCGIMAGGILTVGAMISKGGVQMMNDPLVRLWVGAVAVGAGLAIFGRRRIEWARFLQEGVDGSAGWMDIPRLDDQPAEFEPFVGRVILAVRRTRSGSHGEDR